MLKFLTGRLFAVRLIMLLATAGLVILGIVTIYAVGNPLERSPDSDVAELSDYWQKQVVFAGCGVLAFIAVNMISYRTFGRWSYYIYLIVLASLAVLIIDKYLIVKPNIFISEINGAYRWIKIPYTGLNLQPSELCKIAYILALAWYLRYRSNYQSFASLAGPFALTLLPMVLILAEPDLGTVLLMMPIFFSMIFLAGGKVRHLILIMVLAVVLSPVLWISMKGYQRSRISSVLLQFEPVRRLTERSPAVSKILLGGTFSTRQWENNRGYHLIRSKYAVSSGGLTGNGFRKGPFIKYDFLPFRHNDFIFAAIAHQWGFVGCVVTLILYIIIVICGLEISLSNTDPFGRLLAIGIAAMFVVEVIVNTGMTVGLMPITGLTLPLVSYGGSSLVTSIIAVGLLNNVGRSRPFSVAPKLPR